MMNDVMRGRGTETAEMGPIIDISIGQRLVYINLKVARDCN